jgi:starch synthase
MNILLVASEALPYCKSGGLGDFIWSYSKALVQKGEKASVIIPLYKVIREKHPEVLKELYDNFDFRMSWRTQGCGVFHVVNEGVDFYFTAMDEEFNRDGMYGYGDDNERFASFMMAVNTFVTRHNHFDVVHSNDWQTAVLPLLLTYNPRKIKTVLTIHNPAYQGWARATFRISSISIPITMILAMSGWAIPSTSSRPASWRLTKSIPSARRMPGS